MLQFRTKKDEEAPSCRPRRLPPYSLRFYFLPLPFTTIAPAAALLALVAAHHICI